MIFKGPEFLFILYQNPLLFLEIFCLSNIRQDVTGTTKAQDTHIYVSWNSLAVTVPWDILPPLPPQGHSWAASRTNIPIIDKAGSSQRQVLTFNLVLQLSQCLFRGFQAANAIPSASLSGKVSLFWVHITLISSGKHLNGTSAIGEHGWRHDMCVEHPEFMGEHEWSPQNPQPDELRVGLQSWWLRGAAKDSLFIPTELMETSLHHPPLLLS